MAFFYIDSGALKQKNKPAVEVYTRRIEAVVAEPRRSDIQRRNQPTDRKLVFGTTQKNAALRSIGVLRYQVETRVFGSGESAHTLVLG